MGMAVDESRNHAGITATDPLVGVGCLGATANPRDLCAVDDDGRVGDDAERVAVGVRRVVGDEFPDVGVEDGHRLSIRSEMAEASSASTAGTVACLRSTTTARPSTTTSVTSGAAAANTT